MTEKYKNVTIQVQQVRYYTETIVAPASLNTREIVEWLERD